MVADGLTWRAWALEGADAGRLLNGAHGRERLSIKHGRPTPVTQPRPQTEMLPHGVPNSTLHATQRKSHDGRDGKIWRELVAISPSNETKRSTAASSGPQSPRYEGEPNHDGIAVWRETQSLGETLSTEPAGPLQRPSLKGRSPVTSPVRHRPPSASRYSERAPASELAMPPWMSTLGLSASQVSHASHASPSHSQSFAEAALGRLAWLQAEKEALEGWLNNAGYLSMDKENEIHRNGLTHDHSVLSDVKMHEPLVHSETEPVMERDAETGLNAGRSNLPHLTSLSKYRSSQGIERNETLEARPSSRRASVLEERNYQALATERAAAEAKLRQDLRAVASERWSEPMSGGRQDERLENQHFGILPRNSAPPSGLREIQAIAFDGTETEAQVLYPPTSTQVHQGPRLPHGSRSLAAATQPRTASLGRSSRTSGMEDSSNSRHSSPARGHNSAVARRHTEAGWAQPRRTEASLQLRHSSPPLSPEAQAALTRGHSPSPAEKGSHLHGTSRRSSGEFQASPSQSPGGTLGRQKAPSFSWPGTGTSSFTAEATHANTVMRKASVSSVHQPSGPSLGRARAVTEVGLPSDRSRERFLSVPDVSNGRRLSHLTAGSASRHYTPPRNGTLEVQGRQESEGSETSSSESPEEAAQRQAQVEHDLQELAARLHVPPAPRPLSKGTVNRSTIAGGPIDLLALAGKTKSEAGRALGAGEEVECRPVWRRTIVDSELTMATE